MLLTFYPTRRFASAHTNRVPLHPRRGGKKKAGTEVPEQEDRDDPRTHSRRPVRRGVQVPKLWVVHSRVGASPLRAPAENSSLNAFNLIETVTCLSD